MLDCGMTLKAECSREFSFLWHNIYNVVPVIDPAWESPQTLLQWVRRKKHTHYKPFTLPANKWIVINVRLNLHMSQVAHQDGAYPGIYSTKQLRVFLLPLDGMLVHNRATELNFLVPVYTPRWREAPWESVLPKNTMQCPGHGLNLDCSILARLFESWLMLTQD